MSACGHPPACLYQTLNKRSPEGAACGQSPEDRAKTVAEAKLVLQSVGFPWHIVALEEAPEKASIHRLVEAFILRLQAQFPSTVSTVYRWACVGCRGEGHRRAGVGVPRPRGPLSSSLLADSATAFGAQTSSQLPQTQPPVAQAEAPTMSCCCTGMGGARHCCRT
ncbi:hypothetical protein E2I00_019644 [Balaenoptera physalus]|uniref:Uncharacterized protein n=1 Tax=Balaenoptera physalus TaxID=9770 RepID=A0A6A1QEB4_BALPH|nr:hypothetical protein E2I00_019644 [Balaenoptera physalus]